MVFCGSCGHQNDDNAKFCEGCGEALEFEAVEVIEELPDEKVELDAGDEVIEEVQEPIEEVIEEVIEEQIENLQVEEVIEEPIETTVIIEKQPPPKSEGAVVHKIKRSAGSKSKVAGPAKWENAKEVQELIAQVLHPGSFSGWILCGYQDDNCTLEIQAHGSGGVPEFVPLLQDDQWQYILVRTQDTSKQIKTGGEIKKTTRDVFITWQGPAVSILQRGRFNEHRNTVMNVMQPSHADLVAVGKNNFTEQEVASKSAPLSGSHEIS